MPRTLQVSCLVDVQGAAEKRTEPYLNTVKGVLQAATQHIAKRLSGHAGCAGMQAQSAGGLK